MNADGDSWPGPEAEVGPFEIRGVLDEGGVFPVYLARQRQPIEREVALKVLVADSGLDGAASGFAREQQVLARLRHENVVQVLGAGDGDAGRVAAWLAMEYVDGVPIDAWCRQRRLGVRQVVELFREVCSAVQHVHQKSVVHGNLRPGHVLVAARGKGAVVKLVGFGRARALDSASSDAEEDSTLPDLDIRSDVQALGRLLEQLLPGRLCRDVGFVVRRATAAAPEHRYPSVSEFDAELRAFLAHEPLRGRPWSLGDRFGKLIRRHRLVATTVIALVAALVATIVGFGIGLERAVERGERFGLLATVARLDAAIAQVDAWTLAEPRDPEVIREFLDSPAAELRAELPTLREAVEALRGEHAVAAGDRSDPSEEADRRSVELAQLRGRRAALRRSLDVATGRIPPESDEPFDLPEDADRAEVLRCFDEAKACLDDPASSFDDLLHASAMARAACSRVPISMRSAHEFHRLAAQGLFRIGRHDEARAKLEGLVGAVTEAGRDAWSRLATVAEECAAEIEVRSPDVAIELRESATALAGGDLEEREIEVLAHRLIVQTLYDYVMSRGSRVGELRELVFDATAWRGRRLWYTARLTELESEIAALPERVAQLRDEIERLELEDLPQQWEDEGERFLFKTLRSALPRLEDFVTGRIPEARHRLTWAEGVDAWTRGHPQAGASWEEARRSIGQADGVTAHEAYADSPIELEPQRGLVPIGMNPATRLWEFYHLRSAWDPATQPDPSAIEIPRHGSGGLIEVGGDTGIIFVLIPGGLAYLNAQSRDPEAPNYDPMVSAEATVSTMTIEPYFIARHELTQGQWLRLAGRPHACFRMPGDITELGVADLSHPVEVVNWMQCQALLTAWGLAIPGRSQWAFAARARQSGSWHFGSDLLQMRRYDNIGDATYVRSLRMAGYPAPHEVSTDDGYYAHAPVGRFLPNPFGLHDVSGNVAEWTATPGFYAEPGKPPAAYFICGGDWQDPGPTSRLVYGEPWNPDYTHGIIGVRAARGLD